MHAKAQHQEYSPQEPGNGDQQHQPRVGNQFAAAIMQHVQQQAARNADGKRHDERHDR
ncbi:hypothetical protein D3C87_1987880 [compost metagenome]